MSLIQMKNLSKKYQKKVALDDVNLTLNEGEIVGLLGANGSGKTTLLKILAGLISDYQGEVLLNGQKPGKETKAFVAYLPDMLTLDVQTTPLEAFAFYGDFFADFDRRKAEDMLRFFRLEGRQPLRQMSKGMKEKLQIALVMSRSARIYLLDEPISGVDPAARSTILDGIIRNYAENAMMLFSTHLISDVETVLDRALFLNEGRLILNETTESIREEKGMSVDQLFREVFKCSEN